MEYQNIRKPRCEKHNRSCQKGKYIISKYIIYVKRVKKVNTVNLVGRLTKTPTVSKTQNGISVCRFSIAVKRRFKVDNQTVTDFINVVAWRENAEFIGRYLKQGQMIGVCGSLQSKECKTKSGEKYTGFEIVVDSVESCGLVPQNVNNVSEQVNASEQVQEEFSALDDEDLPF